MTVEGVGETVGAWERWEGGGGGIEREVKEVVTCHPPHTHTHNILGAALDGGIGPRTTSTGIPKSEIVPSDSQSKASTSKSSEGNRKSTVASATKGLSVFRFWEIRVIFRV